jgi:methylated-DNA-[protein]-cysteine S-methyltransferase
LIAVRASDAGLTELCFDDAAQNAANGPPGDIVVLCIAQLDEYFNGKRKKFAVPLDLRGTDFQISVWRALLDVPFGSTASYGRIADAIGRPGSARAVGGANHRNPVSIIVPCHRIIGGDGNLTGYGGGLWRKEWLLRHESPSSA